MRRAAPFFFIAAVIASSSAFAKDVKETYDSGKPKLVYQTDAAGKKSGPYEEFYEDGKSKSRGNYREDLKTGPWTESFDTGKLRLEENYLAGKLNGQQTFHTVKGTVRAMVNYVNGERTGPLALFDDAGKRRCVLNFPHTVSLVERAWSELYPYEPIPLGYDVEPVLVPPYKAGVLKKENQEQALNFLKLFRFLAGVPTNITLDPALSLKCAAGSVMLHKIDHLDHKPDKPADMPEPFYRLAIEGTSHGNIWFGTGNSYTVMDSIRGYMDDSDEKNQSKVGHRQWLMSPFMDKTGFGFAGVGPGFSVTYAHSRSPSARMTQRYTSFPAEGFYPAELIQPHYVWSLHINPEAFSIPNTAVIQVRMEHLDDSWEKIEDVPVKVVSVFTDAGWPTPVIIFKPDLKKIEPGRYLVQIAGLKAAAGEPLVSYVVEFISMADVKQKLPAATQPATKPAAP